MYWCYSQPAWKHYWQLHKSKCWGQVISLPALGHIVYMTAWTKNRQGTVVWRCTRNTRLIQAQAHASNRSCFTLRSTSTAKSQHRGRGLFLSGRGKRADLGDHYSLQFLSDHSQSWFRAPQHSRLTAVTHIQGRGSCQAVLAREKGRALASWARVSCIYQRQAEWEADISQQQWPCGESHALPLQGKTGFPSFRHEQTLHVNITILFLLLP